MLVYYTYGKMSSRTFDGSDERLSVAFANNALEPGTAVAVTQAGSGWIWQQPLRDAHAALADVCVVAAAAAAAACALAEAELPDLLAHVVLTAQLVGKTLLVRFAS